VEEEVEKRQLDEYKRHLSDHQDYLEEIGKKYYWGEQRRQEQVAEILYQFAVEEAKRNAESGYPDSYWEHY